MVSVPLLGDLEKNPKFDHLLNSKAIKVDVLDGADCEFILENYETDEHKEEFHSAIENFLSIDETVLKNVQDSIFEYYLDVIDAGGAPLEKLDKADDVWRHIQLGRKPVVSRRRAGDKLVYISVESECVWEPEHGLQIVFKQGLVVNKVGPYDGSLITYDSNSDSVLEDVVYKVYR